MLYTCQLKTNSNPSVEIVALAIIRIRYGRLDAIDVPHMVVLIVTVFDFSNKLRTRHVRAATIVVKSLIATRIGLSGYFYAFVCHFIFSSVFVEYSV